MSRWIRVGIVDITQNVFRKYICCANFFQQTYNFRRKLFLKTELQSNSHARCRSKGGLVLWFYSASLRRMSKRCAIEPRDQSNCEQLES